MRIIQNFTTDEYKNLIKDFYEYFKDGYEFEEFLKSFLEILGLREVVVKQKSRDDGVDLYGIKYGITKLNNKDFVTYRVQAKRYNPDRTIQPEKIDALRGNMKSNEKGLFITTARVSENAKQSALTKDESKPIIVIDGLDLVKMCIDEQIGFAYKPVFSPDALDEIMKKDKMDKINTIKDDISNKLKLDFVEKIITKNDIRCHMISVPSFIVEQIKNNKNQHSIDVVINGKKYSNIKFCSSRNYLSGVTEILREYKLFENDGSYNEKKAIWSIDQDKQIIYINI